MSGGSESLRLSQIMHMQRRSHTKFLSTGPKVPSRLKMCGGSESPMLFLRCRLALGLASSDRGPLKHHAVPRSRSILYWLLLRCTAELLKRTSESNIFEFQLLLLFFFAESIYK